MLLEQTFRVEPTHLGKWIEMTLWLAGILLTKVQHVTYHVSIHVCTKSGGKWGRAKAIKISEVLGNRSYFKKRQILNVLNSLQSGHGAPVSVGTGS
jgi:hypothetical protein